MRILLVDDHTLFLSGMESFLTAKGFTIAGVAHNGVEAQMKYEMLKPDVVLMDLQMKEMDGIETTRAIRKESPEARIIILTAVEEKEMLFAALEAGAEGYLLKDADPEVFLRHLQNAIDGELAVSGVLGKQLIQEFLQHQQRSAESPAPPSPKAKTTFTANQLTILRHLTDGLTYKEIADAMGLKETSIKYHVRELIDKCKVSNRAQLLRHVAEQGVLQD